MKRVLSGFMVLGWLAAVSVAYADMATQPAVDAGNATCLVSGDKVSGKDFVEHDGKKYGICCAMCADKFKKDPEKFLKAMAEGSEAPEHAMHDDHEM